MVSQFVRCHNRNALQFEGHMAHEAAKYGDISNTILNPGICIDCVVRPVEMISYFWEKNLVVREKVFSPSLGRRIIPSPFRILRKSLSLLVGHETMSVNRY
ncbi:MAG: hypothetical protein CTR54_05800 [Rhizobium sp.]|nr:MAG: hypothetical protein CTR54_05800 [Rhizobium sp.]